MRETIITILQVYVACMCVLEFCLTVTYMVFMADIEKRNADDMTNAYWNRLIRLIARTHNKKLYALLVYIDVELHLKRRGCKECYEVFDGRQILGDLLLIATYVFDIVIHDLIRILAWVIVYIKNDTRVTYIYFVKHYANKDWES